MGTFFSFAFWIRVKTSFLFVIHAPQWIMSLYFSMSVGKSCDATCSKIIFFPVFFLMRFGIFTVAISSSIWWWVQLSQIKTLSLSCKFEIADAPFSNCFKSPLKRAISMEKEFKAISFGTILSTALNACESVTINLGFWLSFWSVWASSSTWTTTEIIPLSRSSLKTWTCGRINLPFGACLSIGVTRITTSPLLTKSAIMFWDLK